MSIITLTYLDVLFYDKIYFYSIENFAKIQKFTPKSIFQKNKIKIKNPLLLTPQYRIDGARSQVPGSIKISARCREMRGSTFHNQPQEVLI